MNQSLFYWLYGFAHQRPWLDWGIIFLAHYLPYIVVILAGLFLLFHHEVHRAPNPYRYFLEKKFEVLKVFYAAVAAWPLSVILKIIIQFERPLTALGDVRPLLEKNDYAFPSQHATFFMALAFSIFFLHKRAGGVFIALAIVIGAARVMAGVHFPIDIIGGFILGFAVSYLENKYFKK